MDDIEVVEFILKNRESEVGLAKRIIRRAVMAYNKELSKALNELKKDLDDIGKSELELEIENGENEEWNDKVGEIQDDIEKRYDVVIDHEDIYLTITKWYAGLIIAYVTTVLDEKAENGEFEYSIDNNTQFMVDLIKFIVKDEIKRNEHTIIGGR